MNLEFRHFSNIIWSIASSKYASAFEELYSVFEQQIESRSRDLTLEDICYILWAVVDKVRIKLDTFLVLENATIVNLLKYSEFNPELFQSESSKRTLDTWSQLSEKIGSTNSTNTDLDARKQNSLEDLDTWRIMNLIWGFSRTQSVYARQII